MHDYTKAGIAAILIDIGLLWILISPLLNWFDMIYARCPYLFLYCLVPRAYRLDRNSTLFHLRCIVGEYFLEKPNLWDMSRSFSSDPNLANCFHQHLL